MKARSSKILAASLSLLVGLSGMPLTPLAAENEPAGTAPGLEAGSSSVVDESGELPEISGDGPADSKVSSIPESTDVGSTEGNPTPGADSGAETPDGEDADSKSTDPENTTLKTTPPENTTPETKDSEDIVPAASADDPAEEAPASAPVMLDEADANTDVLHVSADGSDGAYPTLKAAVDTANGLTSQQITIELDSDITVTENARIKGKDITLDGNGHTITRGDKFTYTSDTNRSWYSPAMIEVTVPDGIDASLTLVDVTLDDAGKAEGTTFAQAPGGGVSSDSYVQDAMVAAYGTNQATARVILGSGAVLQNFGGMSAVRVTGGATLTMQRGSKIQDTTVTDRLHGDDKSNGPAGAVWVQGTSAVMEEGAEITHVVGRAFYVDGDDASVTVGGKITDILADSDMWQGIAGIGIHVRGGATATMTSTAYIGDIDVNAADGSVLGVYGSDLDMQQGAVLKNVKGTRALLMDDLGNDYAHIALLNGTIDSVVNGTVMRASYGHIDLGPTGVVQNCVATNDGQVLYSTNGARYTLEGKILNNKGTAVYLVNHTGGRVEGVMKEGCVISGTRGTGFLSTGVAVRVNNGSLFTMEGGEIYDNDTGVKVSGKTSYKGVTFLMKGGKITNNDLGLSYTVDGESVVQLTGGEISHNKSDYHDYQISAIGGSATDACENFYLAKGLMTDAPIVEVSFGTITLDADYPSIGLGQASQAARTEINSQLTSTAGQENWKTVGSSLWFKAESADSLHFTMDRPYSVDRGIGLYAVYLPLKADGTPADGAKLTQVRLTNAEKLDITLTGLTPGTSYALMLAVSDKYYVTIQPANITVYRGGEHGATNVVDSSNEITTSDSLPEPGFTFDLPKDVSDISQITFKEVNGTRTWTAEPYDDVDGHTVYKLVSGSGQDPVRLQFTDENGKVVVEDDFTVGEKLNKTFSMGIYKGDAGEVEAVVNEDTSGTTYGIILNEGTLTVRGTTDGVQYSNLNDTLQAGKPGVKADADVTFTINDSNLNANQDAIALLFDNIIENTASETGRTSLLTKRGDEALKDVTVPDGMVRNYEFRYLDLVDTSNGNAWVEARDAKGDPAEVTVCWPYPAGTDKNTDFTLLHFEDLHRDMNANEVAGDIANCTVSEMAITKTDTHIEFTTTEFSPFALVWNGPKPAVEEKPSAPTQTVTAQATEPAAQPTAQPAAVVPQTGDNSSPLLWTLLMAVSGGLVVALVARRRRKD